MIRTLDELMDALPERITTFEGSDYPLPLCQAVRGGMPTVQEIRDLVAGADRRDVAHLALHAALAAECYEASRPDSAQLFVRDAALRGLVFSGAKWRAGWAFLLGECSRSLPSQLEARGFIVFPSGGRTTHPVYWLQMMVRYAMIWGRVPPGQEHEMGHLLADDLPGVLVVCGQRCELEALLALAMMKLGCPAIVPQEFPFEEGRQARVAGDEEALDAIATLPNLRVREVEGERISLPAYCDLAHAREPFTPTRTIGGDEVSFFALRSGGGEEGVEVTGEPDGSLGVLIEVDDERLDAPLSDYLERAALELPGYLPGVRTVSPDPFALGLAAGRGLVPDELAGVLQAGLKWLFPRLHGIRVRLLFGRRELAAAAPGVHSFRRQRAEALASLREGDVGHFVACIECQTFSHSHVCIVTPGRPPMCGRDPGQVRAAALFGATWHPYRRRGLKARELREAVAKGHCIDAARGEYEGINDAARRLTDGVIQRVYLHSLNGSPHSSCGCFHYLAFRIDGYGIGVMHRGFEGRAPNGETWDSLANRAGGKQADGVTGLSLGYLRRPEFLKADGGLGAVAWVTAKVLGEVRDLLLPGFLPATEDDVRTLENLARYRPRAER